MAVRLTGSSLATVTVFVPLAFLSEVTGAFFTALSLTMASAPVVSYLFAFLGVPLLSAVMLRPGNASPAEPLTWPPPPAATRFASASLVQRRDITGL